MELLKAYLKERRLTLAAFLLFVGVFAVSFALYGLPLAAVGYPAGLCVLLGACLAAWDYGRAARRHKALKRLREAGEAVLLDLPAALLFIGLGLLCGSVLNVKQAGGICGALLTNLTAWLSGTWFDLELVGGVFKRIAYALPFVHAVELDRAALAGDWAGLTPHLWWVLAYAAAALAAAVLLFLRQMKKQ